MGESIVVEVGVGGGIPPISLIKAAAELTELRVLLRATMTVPSSSFKFPLLLVLPLTTAPTEPSLEILGLVPPKPSNFLKASSVP